MYVCIQAVADREACRRKRKQKHRQKQKHIVMIKIMEPKNARKVGKKNGKNEKFVSST